MAVVNRLLALNSVNKETDRNPRVFLIEGVATVAFAGYVYLSYPDYPQSPRTGKWLTPREQKFLDARLTENAPRTHDASFSWAEVKHSVMDLRIWSFMFAQVRNCPMVGNPRETDA